MLFPVFNIFQQRRDDLLLGDNAEFVMLRYFYERKENRQLKDIEQLRKMIRVKFYRLIVFLHHAIVPTANFVFRFDFIHKSLAHDVQQESIEHLRQRQRHYKERINFCVTQYLPVHSLH